MNTHSKSTAKASTPHSTRPADSFIPAGISTVVKGSIDSAVAINNTCLDMVAAQNSELMDACKNAVRMTLTMPVAMPALAAADLMQRSIDRIIQTEKNVVELAAKPLRDGSQS